METVITFVKEHPIWATVILVVALASINRWGPPGIDVSNYVPPSIGSPMKSLFTLVLKPVDLVSGYSGGMSTSDFALPAFAPASGGSNVPQAVPAIQSFQPAQNNNSRVCAAPIISGCTYQIKRGDTIIGIYRSHPNWGGLIPTYNGEQCFDQSNIPAGGIINVPCGN